VVKRRFRWGNHGCCLTFQLDVEAQLTRLCGFNLTTACLTEYVHWSIHLMHSLTAFLPGMWPPLSPGRGSGSVPTNLPGLRASTTCQVTAAPMTSSLRMPLDLSQTDMTRFTTRRALR
jgi:hypothetical protein